MASRSDRFEKIVTPIIDTLQMLPSFCFIIPVVMLFRVGDVTAHDRHGRLRRGAGDPLHQSRHPAGAAGR